MGKLETVLKGETIRLARREIRPLVVPLQRQVRALTRQVRALEAETHRLARLVAKQEKARVVNISQLTVDEGELKGSRLSPGLIKKLRQKVGITQQQLASLVGVSAAAVQSWEQGVAKPAGDNRGTLIALRRLGRGDVLKLLRERGIGKPDRKPRTGTPAKKTAKRKAAKKAVKGKAAKKPAKRKAAKKTVKRKAAKKTVKRKGAKKVAKRKPKGRVKKARKGGRAKKAKKVGRRKKAR